MAEDPKSEPDLTSDTEEDGLLERLTDIADDVFARPEGDATERPQPEPTRED